MQGNLKGQNRANGGQAHEDELKDCVGLGAYPNKKNSEIWRISWGRHEWYSWIDGTNFADLRGPNFRRGDAKVPVSSEGFLRWGLLMKSMLFYVVSAYWHVDEYEKKFMPKSVNVDWLTGSGREM